MRKCVAGLIFAACGITALAADAPSPPPVTPTAAPKLSVSAQMNQLIARINQKLKSHETNPAGLAEDLKGFDVILAAHPGEKTEELAQVLMTKAMFFIQVIHDYNEGARLLQQLKTDYPRTPQAQGVDDMLAELKVQQNLQTQELALQPGAKFPDFEVKELLSGEPLSLAKFKGKPVLVQFWETSNPPYLQELPGMIAVYQKYHPKGFEILGVSLDTQEPTLRHFLKSRGMTWPQYFDGKKWDNLLAKKYSVRALPMSFLLDVNGRIVARDLRAAAVDTALASMLHK